MIKNNVNFTQAAREIANKLVNQALENEYGCYWETLSYNTVTEEYEYAIQEDLYSGNAGIILYLAEVYRLTADDSLLSIIRKAAKWLTHYCSVNKAGTYAFYTGRSGVAFLFMKLYDILKDPAYLDTAATMLDDCWDLVKARPKDTICDLLNGKAGLLLAFAHQFSITGAQSLLEKMMKLIHDIIGQVHFGKSAGVYWDRSERTMTGLCGFSHGASGIGFVLMELANYFQWDDLLQVAHQAFMYEEACYDSTLGNWPDFRKGIYNDQDLQESTMAYKRKDMAFFDVPRSMHTWCHGAPGIGLARLRMYELYEEEKYAQLATTALNATMEICEKENNDRSFTLCHGRAGNLFLLVYSLQQGITNKSADMLSEHGEAALQQYKRLGRYTPGLRGDCKDEDLSLFNGVAGIGYFYLLCATHDQQLNILMPVLKERHFPLPEFPDNYIAALLCKRMFPKTVRLLTTFDPREYDKLIMDKTLCGAGNIKTAISSALRRTIALSANAGLLSECLDYELQLLELDSKSPVHNYLHMHSRMVFSELAAVNMDNIEHRKVEIAPYSVLVHSRFPWNRINDHPDLVRLRDTAQEEYTLLLKSDAYGVSEFGLDTLSDRIVSLAPTSGSVKDIIAAVMTDFDSGNEAEAHTAGRLIKQQVLELLKTGILQLQN